MSDELDDEISIIGGIDALAPSGTSFRERDDAPAPRKVQGLGVFGEDSLEDAGAGVEELQANLDRSVYKEMSGTAVRLGPFKLRPVTLSTFAMLQEVGSAFVSFTPYLTPDERKDFLKLRERYTKSQTDRGTRMSKGQMARLHALNEKAGKENAQIGNPYMETLIFLTLQDARRTPEEAEELAFGDRSELRKAAVRLGSEVPPGDFERLGKEVAELIADSQKTKVRPAPSMGSPNQGNF